MINFPWYSLYIYDCINFQVYIIVPIFIKTKLFIGKNAENESDHKLALVVIKFEFYRHHSMI